MKLWLTKVLLLFLGIGLCHCGAMFHGTKAGLSLNSYPKEANATIKSLKGNYEETVKTPATVQVKRRNTYTITFEKEGYEPVVISVTHSINGAALIMDTCWFCLYLLPGIIAYSIDAATGGWYDIQPETVSVRLRPLEESKIRQPDPFFRKGKGT
jgi:hypothetical protein